MERVKKVIRQAWRSLADGLIVDRNEGLRRDEPSRKLCEESILTANEIFPFSSLAYKGSDFLVEADIGTRVEIQLFDKIICCAYVCHLVVYHRRKKRYYSMIFPKDQWCGCRIIHIQINNK